MQSPHRTSTPFPFTSALRVRRSQEEKQPAGRSCGLSIFSTPVDFIPLFIGSTPFYGKTANHLKSGFKGGRPIIILSHSSSRCRVYPCLCRWRRSCHGCFGICLLYTS